MSEAVADLSDWSPEALRAEVLDLRASFKGAHEDAVREAERANAAQQQVTRLSGEVRRLEQEVCVRDMAAKEAGPPDKLVEELSCALGQIRGPLERARYLILRMRSRPLGVDLRSALCEALSVALDTPDSALVRAARISHRAADLLALALGQAIGVAWPVALLAALDEDPAAPGPVILARASERADAAMEPAAPREAPPRRSFFITQLPKMPDRFWRGAAPAAGGPDAPPPLCRYEGQVLKGDDTLRAQAERNFLCCGRCGKPVALRWEEGGQAVLVHVPALSAPLVTWEDYLKARLPGLGLVVFPDRVQQATAIARSCEEANAAELRRRLLAEGAAMEDAPDAPSGEKGAPPA